MKWTNVAKQRLSKEKGNINSLDLFKDQILDTRILVSRMISDSSINIKKDSSKEKVK